MSLRDGEPKHKRYTKHQRRHIPLPDGDELIPRAEMADLIGVTERTLRKLKVPVANISNVAYVAKNATLAAYLATHTRHPPQPPKRGRPRKGARR